MAASSSSNTLESGSFYAEYHGHQVQHLQVLHQALIDNCVHDEKPNFIFLAGDSSLDNKHWFFNESIAKKRQMKDPSFTAPCVNGYEQVLNPPRSVQDVAYHLNNRAAQLYGPSKLITINASVEESTIADRDSGLLPHDEFIRDHITENDVLVVSLGGNDVALRPTTRTILSIGVLTRLPDTAIQSCVAVGMGQMEWLFHDRIEIILNQMTAKTRPKKIIVCMIYYLDETPGGSWADGVLAALGYNSNPAKVQLIIKTLFQRIENRGFDIPGTTVECFPLFEVLDGKDTNDYVQRVEPSVQGGKKMADALLAQCI
jgi:hypothetical protein